MKTKTQILFSLFLTGIVAFIIGTCFYLDVRADTGRENATRIERGETLTLNNVSVSSTTGAAIFAASFKRPDGLCFNNTSTTVWVGSVTATIDRQVHTNIIQGIPVLSSTTFKIDGQFTGPIYATCNDGVAACEMRCLEGTVAQ